MRFRGKIFRAKNQEPRAKSQESRAKSQEPRTKNQELIEVHLKRDSYRVVVLNK